MTHPLAPTDAAQPSPPRFWWLKRIAIGFVALVIVMLVVRLWWGHLADKRLTALTDPIRGRGDNLTPADLAPAPLPDDQNAALLLREAAVAIDPTVLTPRESTSTESAVPPFSATWYGQAEGSMQANAQSLALAHEARKRRSANWDVKLGRPAFNTLMPQLSPQRGLANVIADGALHAHVTGDDALAIERIRDLLHQADMVDHHPPILVTHLVATGIRAMAVIQLQVIAPELQVIEGGADDVAPTRGPATRKQVEDLIAVLLDESTQLVRAREAVAGERIGEDDTVEWFTRGNWIITPAVTLDRARMIAYHEQIYSAMTAPTHPQAELAMPNAGTFKDHEFTFARLGSDMVTPSYSRYVGIGYASRFERRAAIVALAVRLYTLDHGAYPARLEDLVPQYLPSVPLDPLAPGAQSLGYVILEQGRRPVVYSVGDNGIDDTISGAAPLAVPHVGWQQSSPDQWRDLSRIKLGDIDRSSQTVDDEGEEPADPRDDEEADDHHEQP